MIKVHSEKYCALDATQKGFLTVKEYHLEISKSNGFVLNAEKYI